MNEYISKKTIIDALEEENERQPFQPTSIYSCVIPFIRKLPAADVQPVKHGFWKALMMSDETGWDLSLTGGHDAVCEYVCSVCGKPAIVDEFGEVFLPDYCPRCGVRMDGDSE